MHDRGMVSLVGAGPGDPELLTVKAHRLLQYADVVVYDRLVSDAVLEMIPGGVMRIPVGKAPGQHCVPQQQINDIIVSLSRAGHHVVRLKGGDPYLFGRGGEEAQALRRHGIDFEVVPGITAAAGCSAYGGIPLTHRGISRGVHFITGHFRDDEILEYDWPCLANSRSTLVFYMAIGNLGTICEHLVEAGMPATTPAAAIQDGTSRQQQRLLSTVARLQQDIVSRQLRAPAVIIIGDVVKLADELDWFQQQLLPETNPYATDADDSNCAHRG